MVVSLDKLIIELAVKTQFFTCFAIFYDYLFGLEKI